MRNTVTEVEAADKFKHIKGFSESLCGEVHFNAT